MGIINRLSEQLSNMIAAGEVVERPSGIIKELVENSIDAKATQISISAEQGGILSLSVVDNGTGMDAQDALLAFERHATSKIKESNDLWNIHTMGFRGEALPSIASVSHVRLRTNDGKEGTEVEIKYGKLDHASPIGTPRGTSIEVKNLFQKTPARFKHLKTPQYEFSLISDVVQKFALSHPEIAFTLHHDGKLTFRSSGSGSLREVIMQIYGREVAKSAISLQGKDQDYTIAGYAVQPQYNRATKYYMLLFINGRMVRSYRLQKAVADAYAPYLPKDRYPITVVNVSMDAQLVDVNVHPSKWEIRLSKEKQLERLLFDTVKQALETQISVPEAKPRREKETIQAQQFDFTYTNAPENTRVHESINQSFQKPPLEVKTMTLEDLLSSTQIQEPDVPYTSEPEHAPAPLPSFASDALPEPEKESQHASDDQRKDACDPPALKQTQSTSDEGSKAESSANKPSAFPQLQVIGQFHNCYIIAQGEAGLYIIDQHAAAERFHYEQFSEMIYAGKTEVQPLLIPITLEVPLQVVSALEQLNEKLAALGIHFELFGNHTLVCRELPVWLHDVEEKQYLQDMVDLFIKEETISIEQLRKGAIASLACHSSIRFHRPLTTNEMKQVIADLASCKQPYHCPHGRPTMIIMSEKELEKDFKRIL